MHLAPMFGFVDPISGRTDTPGLLWLDLQTAVAASFYDMDEVTTDRLARRKFLHIGMFESRADTAAELQIEPARFEGEASLSIVDAPAMGVKIVATGEVWIAKTADDRDRTVRTRAAGTATWELAMSTPAQSAIVKQHLAKLPIVPSREPTTNRAAIPLTDDPPDVFIPND